MADSAFPSLPSQTAYVQRTRQRKRNKGHASEAEEQATGACWKHTDGRNTVSNRGGGALISL